MSTRARYGLAAFAVSAVIIFAIIGFALVDLSSDRYMPGRFGTMLSADLEPEGGYSVSLMGWELAVGQEQVQYALERLHRFRGLFPARTLLSRQLALFCAEQAGRLEEYITPPA